MRKSARVIHNRGSLNFGKEPFVVVPLKIWQEIQDRLEDAEALSSQRYLHRIDKARNEVKQGKIIHPFR